MLETSARRSRGRVPAPVSRHRSRRTPPRLLAVVAAVLVAAGCSSEETSGPRPAPTPLARLDTSALQVPRIEFCTLVPGSAVRDALAGKPDSSSSYRNGDEVDLPDVGKQAVHEVGCSWSTAAGATARAWVFARPVDAALARQAIASSREVPGCRVATGPAYGRPGMTQTCRRPDGSVRVRHAGLFGETWLSCEVGARAGEVGAVRTRADAWCVEVVNALNTAG